MPRSVKGSGKKPVSEKKERKPYPTYQERIEAADKKIEQLQKLNASREALIAQTEAKLEERKAALAKSREALEKVTAKRERLVALMNKPEEQPKPKLFPEERAAHRREALAKAREAKKAQKAQMEAFLEKLAQSGKTIDDLMAELNKREKQAYFHGPVSVSIDRKDTIGTRATTRSTCCFPPERRGRLCHQNDQHRELADPGTGKAYPYEGIVACCTIHDVVCIFYNDPKISCCRLVHISV